MRGKWGPTEALAKVGYPGINMPLSIFGLDIWGREVESTGIHIETGDIDGYCRAIPGRINRAPWSPRPSAQVLMSMYTETGEPCEIDPRNALQRMWTGSPPRVSGRSPRSSLSFTWLTRRCFSDRAGWARIKGPGPDQQQMYSLSELRGQSDLFAEIRAAAIDQGLPIDTIIKEAAPGQFEVNLKHRDDAMAAADDTVLLRRLITECAHKHGLRATFMAKPFLEWPGNGMHVHASIIDANGDNILPARRGTSGCNMPPRACWQRSRTHCCSIFPASTAIGACSRAPMRRRESPGDATTVRWWFVSRVRRQGAASRASHVGRRRQPLFRARRCAGRHARRIGGGKLPPPPVEGNAYNVPLPQLSDDMDDAIEDFERSDFIRRLFGPELRRIFAEIKREELKAFDNEITPLERSTYL
jgi:glutamine synthetase